MQSADSIPNVLISRVFLTAEVLFRFGLSAMFLLSAISKAINPLETVGAIKVVLGFSGYLADCGVAILIVSEVVLSFLLVFSGNRRPFTIGRLSRPDPLKYPINFPTLYESLISNGERLKIQSWSSDLAAEYSWRYFRPDRWIFQEFGAEPANSFLQSIDVFVYPLGHRFIESWGRSTVEAMLTGCVPIVPSGHHLENLLVHGESGFVCQNDDDFIKWTRELCGDVSLFMKMSRSAAQYSRDVICNSEANCRLWIQALEEW